MSSSRYAINDLLVLRSNIDSTSPLDQETLGELLIQYATEKSNFPDSISLGPRVIPILASVESPVAGDVGRILIDLEVELRRTLAFVTERAMLPYRDRGTVEILVAHRDSITNLLISLASPFDRVLATEPLEFLLALSWFWDHRLNQTRTRPAKSLQEQFAAIIAIAEAAKHSVASRVPVMITLRIDGKGFTKFSLEPRQFLPTNST
jgi:hypothetical protein